MKMRRASSRSSFRRNGRGVSPAISTVILTSAIVVLLLVTIVFTNNFLNARIAENEFSAMEQFMQTVALQVDDVAWTLGSTETIRYSSKYGDVSVLRSCLSYTIYFQNKTGQTGWYSIHPYLVGAIVFNVPVSQYTLFNGYYELISPYSDSTLTLKGESAPLTRVFAIEKLPMSDGSFIRIVVAPSIRLLNSTISQTFYVKMYLPVIELTSSPKLAQSITLTGSSISANTINNVKSINVTVDFPNAIGGFDNSFFHFPSRYETISIPNGFSDVVLEVYASKVTTIVGAYS
jgi:hypothetical protein